MTVEFDAAQHIYTHQGRRLCSVTQALSMVTSYDFVDPIVLERARIFGHHVHHATHLFDIGDLDEPALDPGLQPYLAQYKQFLVDTKFKVEHSEEIVHHEQLRYAGTLDKRGFWKRSSWVLDLKSGAVTKAIGPQTAAYQQAVAQHPRRRLVLQLMADRYRLRECRDLRDFSIFISALNLYRFTHRINPYDHPDVEEISADP